MLTPLFIFLLASLAVLSLIKATIALVLIQIYGSHKGLPSIRDYDGAIVAAVFIASMIFDTMIAFYGAQGPPRAIPQPLAAPNSSMVLPAK